MLGMESRGIARSQRPRDRDRSVIRSVNLVCLVSLWWWSHVSPTDPCKSFPLQEAALALSPAAARKSVAPRRRYLPLCTQQPSESCVTS